MDWAIGAKKCPRMLCLIPMNNHFKISLIKYNLSYNQPDFPKQNNFLLLKFKE